MSPRGISFLILCFALSGLVLKVMAGQTNLSGGRRSDADRNAANYFDGVVSGPNGPEAGVWVIVETSSLATKFRRIVVTDDKGRFLVPDLPKADYKVWVRGYGLMDSSSVEAVAPQTLKLVAVPAPDARSAAQVYPANYWFSLVHVPSQAEFPLMTAGGLPSRPSHTAPGAAAELLGGIHNQNEWIYSMRQCQHCHQLGDKATREIEPNLGTFDTTLDAWDRRLKSGQLGSMMQMALNQFPRRRALTMLSDWTDRLAAGEVPPVPPRPQGVERNVVLTEWDWGKGSGDWIHDVTSTDKRNPTRNAKGEVYATAVGTGSLVGVDPNTSESIEIKVPTRDELKSSQSYGVPMSVDFSSPYFGDKLVWTDFNSPHNAMMDQKGRVWVTSAIRVRANPSFCKEGSSNAYAKNYPINSSDRQVSLYAPETNKWTFIDTCFGTHHLQFAYDKDNTLYFSGQDGALGWVDTRVFEQTGDGQAAQGWCPAYFDAKGDGRFDPNVDKVFTGFPYGLAVNPVDGSVWYAATGLPGAIVRIDRGPNPPETCRAEIYEPPYENPKAPGKMAFGPHGVDIDTNGIVWVSLLGSGQLASFDRRKCAVRSGPTATGQQCPEAWSLFQLPGPVMKGADETGSADLIYFNWVDQSDILGLGKNVAFATGSNSDSLLALQPGTNKWVVLRVPYPLGVYSRGLDGRIDDVKTGWKGRGLWATYSPIPVWHIEGGKAATPMLIHIQLRPSPLAR